MLAMSPVLTSGYYSESLSQSVSSRLPRQLGRPCTPPPPFPRTPRDEGVVIEAGMSFILGSTTTATSFSSSQSARLKPPIQRRVGVRHHFKPMAAHTITDTRSSALSNAIHEFLDRSDHVASEWKQLGRDGDKVLPPLAQRLPPVRSGSALRSDSPTVPTYQKSYSFDSNCNTSRDECDCLSKDDSESDEVFLLPSIVFFMFLRFRCPTSPCLPISTDYTMADELI